MDIWKKINHFFKPDDNHTLVKNLPKVYQEYNLTRVTGRRDSLCFAPSVNMYFAQDGNVHVCCHNTEYSIGKYPDQSLHDIWHSDKAKELRDTMASYKLAKSCNICADDLTRGNYQEVRARHFDSLPVHPTYPVMMEFLLDNTCNLECVMCKGEYSSLIRQNREKLPPLANPYGNAFISDLGEFLPHLREARFSGSGEAFLIEINYKIWEKILTVNRQCLLMIQTNGHVLNGRIKDLLNRGQFQIGVSLDSLDKESFEAIRVHANYDRVMENISYFNSYCKEKGTRFNISLCVMIQNWHELPAFVNFCNKLDCTLTLHKVWHPQEYSLNRLNKRELLSIHRYLSEFSFVGLTSQQQTNIMHYQYFLSVLKDWSSDSLKPDNGDAVLIAADNGQLKIYFERELKQYLDAAERIKVEFPKLKKDELIFFFERNLKDYLRIKYHEESESLIIFHNILAKLNVVLDYFKEYDMDGHILQQVSGTAINSIVSYFLAYSAEDLCVRGSDFLVDKVKNPSV